MKTIKFVSISKFSNSYKSYVHNKWLFATDFGTCKIEKIYITGFVGDDDFAIQFISTFLFLFKAHSQVTWTNSLIRVYFHSHEMLTVNALAFVQVRWNYFKTIFSQVLTYLELLHYDNWLISSFLLTKINSTQARIQIQLD